MDVDGSVVGVHLYDEETLMVVFVKGNGKLEYNYLNKELKNVRTLKVNKMYEI
jgi:hypothetical protein